MTCKRLLRPWKKNKFASYDTFFGRPFGAAFLLTQGLQENYGIPDPICTTFP